jgi:ketosteroid isomerase-like protein
MVKRMMCVGLVMTLAACTESAVDREEEGAALMELSREWSALVASGNLEAGMNFWADDALMLPPDMPILDGRAAIREYVESAAELPGFQISWEPLSVHVSESGDMAYMIERNVTELDDADGNRLTMHGKVVTVWRKDSEGNWRNVVDMWNAAPPPAE